MDIEQRLRTFLGHIFECVSDRLIMVFEQDIEIAFKTHEAIFNATDQGRALAKIVDWWRVSAEFAEQAKKLGEIVVDTPMGILWGQTTPTDFMLVFNPQAMAILDKV